jgi:hypothetical protein
MSAVRKLDWQAVTPENLVPELKVVTPPAGVEDRGSVLDEQSTFAMLGSFGLFAVVLWMYVLLPASRTLFGL